VSPLHIVLVVLAGVGAGTINSIVGSGSLLTFPLLLAIGYSPVVANASNTLGVVPGAVLGAYGYREELRGQWPLVGRLAIGSVLGGATGATLFLVLAPSVFKAAVPALIGVACVLIVLQPLIARRAASRSTDAASPATTEPATTEPLTSESLTSGSLTIGSLTPGLFIAVFLVGIYGGYFGGGQGIMLIAVLGLFLRASLQEVNGAKNVLAATANAVAAVAFTIAGHVAWEPALLIAAGSAVGGILGARYGRRLSPLVLRCAVVVVGVVTIVRLS
jgi:uncharacterized protein